MASASEADGEGMAIAFESETTLLYKKLVENGRDGTALLTGTVGQQSRCFSNPTVNYERVLGLVFFKHSHRSKTQ